VTASSTGVRVQVFRDDPKDAPLCVNRDYYEVLENLNDKVDIEREIAAASTSDSEQLRQFASGNVFWRKLGPDPLHHHQLALPSSVTVLFAK
jgi:hypothetical protein